MKKRKRVRVGILLVVILLTIIGIVLWQKEKKEDALAITLKETREAEFGKEAHVSDFIQEIKGTITDDTLIDTTSLGEKEVIVKYRNEKNRKKKAKYTVQVVDKEAPKIFFGNSYTVKQGYQKDLLKVLFTGDNCDDNPTRRIEGDYNVNEVGKYNLTYIVKDASGNEAKKNFTLNVIEDKKVDKKDNQPDEAKEKEKIQFQDVIGQYKTKDNKIGLDVSKWQEEIDWQKVKEAGAEFVMIRVGYQDGMKGENKLDPCFYQNIEGAKKVGLPVGVYFFSYASSKEEAESQADWIMEKVKDYSLELPINFDWENWTSFPEFQVSFHTLNEIARAFLERVESKGYTPSLYSSKNYLEKIWTNTKYDTWLAHYTERTNYTGSYHMWQMCETGRIDGINKDIDIDIWYQ